MGKSQPTIARARRSVKLSLLAGLCAAILLPIGLSGCAWLWPKRGGQTHEELYRKEDRAQRPIKFSRRQLDESNSLCLPKYNYWCIKTPPGDRWKGQAGEDLAQHAIFRDPVYSARAFTRVMRTYRFKHNLRTAREILSRYAPEEDCIGSKAMCPINDGALHGARGLPYGKVGSQWVQYSPKPLPGFAEGGSCFVALMVCHSGRNPTQRYAKSIASVLDKGIDEDLELFHDDGRINVANALPVFKQFARWEIGDDYRVRERLIFRGMVLEQR